MLRGLQESVAQIFFSETIMFRSSEKQGTLSLLSVHIDWKVKTTAHFYFFHFKNVKYQ